MSDAPHDGGFFPVVYGELKRLASARLAGERAGHSLDATALVHEAYLRLGDAAFADRSGFFRAAALAMQRILVDHARRRKAEKRGGGARTLALDDVGNGRVDDPDFLLDVAEALEQLGAEDPGSAEVARHRLFAGLSIEEAAEALGLSRASAFREWAYARSWLATALASAR
jgi:RNA polymerase sigma factor (TIGR02999 family)